MKIEPLENVFLKGIQAAYKRYKKIGIEPTLKQFIEDYKITFNL